MTTSARPQRRANPNSAAPEPQTPRDANRFKSQRQQHCNQIPRLSGLGCVGGPSTATPTRIVLKCGSVGVFVMSIVFHILFAGSSRRNPAGISPVEHLVSLPSMLDIFILDSSPFRRRPGEFLTLSRWTCHQSHRGYRGTSSNTGAG